MIPDAPGIYRIWHAAAQRAYVGSAVSIRNRWSVHRHQLQHGKHHSVKLQRAWDKHGPDAFAIEVLELVAEKADLLVREQAWIDGMRAYERGYNSTPKAGSSFGRKFSDETKQRMSAKRKGRLHTVEARAKMSESHKGRTNSAEHNARIAAAHKGKIVPLEVRERMSLAAKARVAKSPRRPDGSFGRVVEVAA